MPMGVVEQRGELACADLPALLHPARALAREERERGGHQVCADESERWLFDVGRPPEPESHCGGCEVGARPRQFPAT
jgi:hypothetical protein